MKLIILNLTASLLSLLGQAVFAQDPNPAAAGGHCAQQMGRIQINADGSFRIPEQVTISGQTNTQNIEQGEGLTTVRIDENSRFEIAHEGGKARQIRFYDNSPGTVTANGLYAVTEYNYRNGICYINRSADFRSGAINNRTSEAAAYVRRDTNACREVMTYFERNPSAAACSCGNPAEDAKLREILDRHQIPVRVSSFTRGRQSGQEFQVVFGMSDSYHGDTIAKVVAPAAGNGTYQAINLVEHCLRSPLMRSALADRRLWAGDPAMEVPPASGALQEPAR